MAKASTIQSSFNAGELSPTLDGRVDLAKYANGCAKMENFYPLVQGGARKRSGTRFVSEVKNSANLTRLIPFEFGTTQAYILEFGNLYMRVYKDGGTVLEASKAITGTTNATPVEVTTAAHSYVTGEEVYISGTGIAALDGKYWTITVTAATTFTLDTSTAPGSTSATGTAERVYEVATPYSSASLDAIQFAQSADVLYLAHPDYNPRKLTRTAHDAWTLSLITFDHVPFEPQNLDTTLTVYASAATGTGITLTASSALFVSSMVGGQFKLSEIVGSNHGVWESRSDNTSYKGTLTPADTGGSDTVYFEGNVYLLQSKGGATKTGTSAPIHDTGTESDGKWDWTFHHAGEGYVTITAVAVDGLTATADVVKRLPASVVGVSGATHRWAHGAWTGKNGYPRTVSFFEDRLWWAGTANNPQTLWASKTSEYENHHIVDLDESALIFTLNTDQVNVIEWINAGKVLMIGTAGGEFVVSAATETEALVPGNVRVVRHSTYGSKTKVAPVRVEQVLLFVQRSGRKIRELVFDDTVNAYVAPDMTILADHVTLGGITRLAFQQEPNRMLWGTLANGGLVCFTYERAQQVTAWHRHTIGGTDSKVESIAVIPHPNEDQDQLWMIVSRTIGGATKRYVEVLEPEWLRANAASDAFFVDSGLSYSGVAATTMTGLGHLEGETVSILADGATHLDKVVSSGSVTLDRAATSVHIGLQYSATLQTMRLDAGAADGTAQGKTKRITNVVVRLDQTGGGLRYGPTEVDADMDEFHLRDSLDPMDAPVPLFDGDTDVLPWPSGYEQAGKVTVRHTLPLPCTVTAIMPQLITQDR